MRNPDFTKEQILKESGTLFNTQGYKATSISDITDATGFTKGAIYRHFDSKASLELETLKHLTGIMFDKMREQIKLQETAGDKLRAIFRFFESYISDPPVKGGCPLLNVAIEADDAHPELKEMALSLLNTLKASLVRILENGQKNGQIKEGVDKDSFASLTIALLEGAIMMSKLAGNDDDIKRVTRHLQEQLKLIEA